MDGKAWQSAKALFYEALERGPEERQALLADVDGDLRREVEELLAAHERAEKRPETAAPRQDGPGTVVGRYKLLQEIGEGGFGVVYLAEQQEPVRRRVALKVIKVGMDTKQVIARFEAERQALAILDHPNIAKVLDGGTTANGRPYFVMELVKGIPITEYCDQASLDTRERLRLFNDVCRAVHHAHQKGIIHRDLKPANIPVTLEDAGPTPKVIDFGIAKATDRHLTEKTLFTEFRQIVGTPEYMAPEQAGFSGMDVDTRADVYALGVLLYELLTGTKPFEMKTLLEQGWNEILRVIREVDPPRPSTKLSTMGEDLTAVARSRQTEPKLLGRLVRGDLDWIVMKALEKDRSRRYESATALARDVQHYLDDEPVEATPPSAAYRLSKFVRRNKAAVVGAAAVLLALLGGFVFTTMGFVEASRQRHLAESERDEADRARSAEAAAREQAQAAADEARTERDDKEQARAELAEALELSEGTRLLAQSQALLPKDPTLALLLAIEGAERAPGAQGNQALLEAMWKVPPPAIELDADAPVASQVVFAPDGRRLAVSYWDGSLRVFDVQNGACLSTMRLDQVPVHYLSWAAATNRIAAVSNAGAAGVWDGASYEPLVSIPPDAPGASLDGTGGGISRDGSKAVLGRWVIGSRLLDLEAGRVLEPLPYASGERVSLSPGGDRLLVGDKDPGGGGRYRLMLRDLDSGEERRIGRPVSQLARSATIFSPDGAQLVVPVEKDVALLFDACTGEVLHDLRMPASRDLRGVMPMGFSADGRRVALWDGRQVWFWDTRDWHMVSALRDVQGAGTLSRDGTRYYVVDRQDGPSTLRVYCVATGAELHTVVLTAAPGPRFALSPDGDRVALVIDGSTWVLQLTRDRTLFDGENVCGWAPVGPEGRYWVSGALQGRPPRIWDLDALHPVRPLADHWMTLGALEGLWHSALAVAASPDGRRVVTGGQGGAIVIWDAETGRRLRSWNGHRGPIWSAAFSPDGSRVLTAAQDETARVWDVATGRAVHVLGTERPFGAGPGPTRMFIYSRWAAFDPTGARILTRLGNDDGAQVWDAETGALLHACPGAEGRVFGAQFTGDGKSIVVNSAGNGGTTLHDAATGACLRRWPGTGSAFGAYPRRITSRDGRRVLLRNEDGVAEHDLATGERVRLLPLDDWLGNAWYAPGDTHVAAQTARGGRLVAWSLDDGKLCLDVRVKGSIAGPPPFSRDGRHLLAWTRDGLRPIPLDPLPTARAIAPRALTSQERALYGLPPASDAAEDDRPVRVREGGSGWAEESRVVEAFRRLVAPSLPDLAALDEAERLLRIEVRAVGMPSFAAVRILHVLAMRARAELDWPRAEGLFRAAHERASAALGPQDAVTAMASELLAQACVHTGNGAEAERLLRPMLDRWRTEGIRSRTAIPMGVLGAAVLAQGRVEEAGAILEEAVRLGLEVHGWPEESPWLLEARGLRGAALAARGRNAEAEALLVASFEQMAGLGPSIYYLRLEALRRLVRFFEETGRPEEAAAWRGKARPEDRVLLGWAEPSAPTAEEDPVGGE